MILCLSSFDFYDDSMQDANVDNEEVSAEGTSQSTVTSSQFMLNEGKARRDEICEELFGAH